MELAATIGKTAEPILSGRGLGKSYGALRVLHDVDFDVFPRRNGPAFSNSKRAPARRRCSTLSSGDARLDAGVLTFAGARLQSEAPPQALPPAASGARTYQIPASPTAP